MTHGRAREWQRVPLEESDRAKNLQLGRRREGIPLSRGAAGRSNIGVRDARRGQVPREVDAVGLHDKPDERRHRHAAVLDLSSTQEADDGLLARKSARLAHARRRQPERIVEADGRVQLLGERLEIRHLQQTMVGWMWPEPTKWRLVRGQSCVRVRSAASVTVSIFGAARGTTRGAVTAPVYDSTVLEETANIRAESD